MYNTTKRSTLPVFQLHRKKIYTSVSKFKGTLTETYIQHYPEIKTRDSEFVQHQSEIKQKLMQYNIHEFTLENRYGAVKFLIVTCKIISYN